MFAFVYYITGAKARPELPVLSASFSLVFHQPVLL